MDRPAADRRTARAQAGHIEVEFLQQVEREWMHGAFGVAARRSRTRWSGASPAAPRSPPTATPRSPGRKELAPCHPSPRKDARLAQHANFVEYQSRRRGHAK